MSVVSSAARGRSRQIHYIDRRRPISENPVFLDESGRRWKIVKWLIIAAVATFVAVPMLLLISIEKVVGPPLIAAGEGEVGKQVRTGESRKFAPVQTPARLPERPRAVVRRRAVRNLGMRPALRRYDALVAVSRPVLASAP